MALESKEDIKSINIHNTKSDHKEVTRLCRLRHRECMSKVEVAKILGVSTKMYGIYEADPSKLSGKELKILSKKFQTSSDYILNISDTALSTENIEYEINNIVDTLDKSYLIKNDIEYLFQDDVPDEIDNYNRMKKSIYWKKVLQNRIKQKQTSIKELSIKLNISQDVLNKIVYYTQKESDIDIGDLSTLLKELDLSFDILHILHSDKKKHEKINGYSLNTINEVILRRISTKATNLSEKNICIYKKFLNFLHSGNYINADKYEDLIFWKAEDKNIPQRIKTLRKKHRLNSQKLITQKDLANMIKPYCENKCSETTIKVIEASNTKEEVDAIKIIYLSAIAHIWDLSLDCLVGKYKNNIRLSTFYNFYNKFIKLHPEEQEMLINYIEKKEN